MVDNVLLDRLLFVFSDKFNAVKFRARPGPDPGVFKRQVMCKRQREILKKR